MPGPVDLPPWEKSKHLQLAVDDMPFADILSHLHPAVNFISHALQESPESRVLVHCFQGQFTVFWLRLHCCLTTFFLGVSRSTTVVCAYLMVSKGWSVSQALAHVKAARRVAEPNFGFVSQLEEFQQTIKSWYFICIFILRSVTHRIPFLFSIALPQTSYIRIVGIHMYQT